MKASLFCTARYIGAARRTDTKCRIGFIAGVIAKFITPGDIEPSGFILTTILGIAGAFVATYLGQAIGWYRAGQGARLIGAVVGAIIILMI
ncbi:MAG: GlsB/YeaQ/YmgE family stress response membrane protein [Alphaproteobacteria bacterium]|nr:GlsB/YeaQ/YmgE family stress response membrane protein [Alphaproteobacteria bacterium]